MILLKLALVTMNFWLAGLLLLGRLAASLGLGTGRRWGQLAGQLHDRHAGRLGLLLQQG